MSARLPRIHGVMGERTKVIAVMSTFLVMGNDVVVEVSQCWSLYGAGYTG